MQPIVFSILILFFAFACARSLTIFTNEKAKIMVVQPGESATEENIGETPMTVDPRQLEGKFLKVAAEGRIPQIIVFTTLLGGETQLSVNLATFEPEEDPNKDEDKDKDKKDGEDKASSLNTIMRMLMKSYQLLANNDAAGAEQIAQDLLKIKADLSSPHIIIGLAKFRKGEKSGAYASFQTAKSLDPEDKEIDRLLEISK
jgi:hypothetical protein